MRAKRRQCCNAAILQQHFLFDSCLPSSLFPSYEERPFCDWQAEAAYGVCVWPLDTHR